MRYLASGMVNRLYPLLSFPYGTLVVNVVGCLLVGFLSELAASRGVAVTRTVRLLLFGATLATASVLCQSGPIGFVGLLVPHAVRRRLGAGHRRLLPACLLTGATFLILADTLCRTILPEGELPIGVLTSLIGVPAFLWILGRRAR